MTSKRELGIQNLIPLTLSRMFLFLFALMLYVHGKQLMSGRAGSAVAWWLMPRTPDPEVGGSSPTRVKPCCVLGQGHLLPKSTGYTQEAVAPSQHD